ncbi:MAG: anion permease [Burkholderiales bacterium]|nr:MAG: anion permease [Burkholderiales bacterium]
MNDSPQHSRRPRRTGPADAAPADASGPGATARRVASLGRIGGPALALLVFVLLPEQYAQAGGDPVSFTAAGRATLAMMCWMAIWWLTEAVPIEATALLPVAAFPLLGVATVREAAAPYGSDVVFLFLGGFLLAAAIRRWGLDRRIAFAALGAIGARTDRVVAGVLGVTAFLSMWVSNTATAAIMLPIAASLVPLAANRDPRDAATPGPAAEVDPAQPAGGRAAAGGPHDAFGVATMLAVAYGASIGGVATLIGSPPNGIAARFLAQSSGMEISFATWMALGLPLPVPMLFAAWLVLTRLAFRVAPRDIAGGRAALAEQLRALGPLNAGERTTIGVAATAAMAWMFRPWLGDLQLGGGQPLAGLTDASIAVIAALSLFVLPGDRNAGRFAMDWETARTIPWGVLVLFGGGLSLAAAVEANGVAHFVGELSRGLGAWPALAILAVVIAATVFLSELTSNTAQVATMVPLLAAAAPALGIEVAPLVVSCALAASCAFMMPVGTPPNAIVFGSGYLTIPIMCRAGLWLNLIGIAVLTALGSLLVPWLLR